MAPNPFFARLGLVSSPAGSLSNLSVGVGTALDATNRTGFYFDSVGEDLHIVANAIDAVVIDEAGVTFNVPITVDGGGPTTLNAPLILEQTTSGQDWLQFSDGTTTLANFQRAGTDVVFEVDGTIWEIYSESQSLQMWQLAAFSFQASNGPIPVAAAAAPFFVGYSAPNGVTSINGIEAAAVRAGTDESPYLAGVSARADNQVGTAGGRTVGVYGAANALTAAVAIAPTFGVLGTNTPGSNLSAIYAGIAVTGRVGVGGFATQAGSVNYGVYGRAANGTTNYAGYFDGDTVTIGTHGIDTGSAAEPSLYFNGDTNTGIYSSANNVVNFSADNGNRMQVEAGKIRVFQPLVVTTDGESDPGGGAGPFSNAFVRMVTDDSGTSGILMQNSNSGSSADFRFALFEDGNINNVGYLAFSMPSTNNTATTLFGLARKDGAFLFYNKSSGSDRTLALGTLDQGSLLLGTNNTARFKISLTEIINELPTYFQDGVVGAPGIAFEADTDTGLYRPAANTLAITAGGVEAARFSSAGLALATGAFRSGSGAAGAPAYSFSADTNTGMYNPGADQLGFAVNGVAAWTVTTAGATLNAGRLQVPNGTAAAPTFTFTGDNNTGIYRVGAGVVGVTAGGTLRASFATALATFTTQILAPVGSEAAPTYAMGEVGSGMYMDSPTVMAFAVQGVRRFAVESNGFTFYVPLRSEINGTAGSPTYSWNNDEDTGLYLPSVGTIGVSVGGTQRLAISTTLATFSVPVSAPSLSINGSNVNGIATSTVNSATAATVGQVYLCNTSGAGFAVTLPLASTVTNQWVWIKKTSADANTLTIATTNPDLIDGAATQDITTQNESVIVVSNGSGWFIF